jgi:hypothetical protein
MWSAAETESAPSRDFVHDLDRPRTSAVHEQMLLTSLLGQIMAGICFGMLSCGSLRHHFPWWGIALTAAGLLLVVCIISGLGKWEAPAIISIGLVQDYYWKDLSVGLVALFSISMFVSFLSYLSVAFRKREEFSAFATLLRVILTPVILLEIGLLIAGIMFVVWFIVAWDSSANFG